jgi:hypothetical protein
VCRCIEEAWRCGIRSWFEFEAEAEFEVLAGIQ